MHHFFLLSLVTILSTSATSSPPMHHPYSSATQRHEYIEVTRPLPFDSLTPSCTLPLLSSTFTTTTNTTYSTPPNCAWSNVVLHFSATSSGSPYGRVAAVWLSGAELLRTSTPQSTTNEIFWNFRKDVTRYAALLRQSNLTLAAMLDNSANDVAIYQFNLTFLYYNTPLRKLKDDSAPPNLKNSLELNENPADLILPVSSTGEEGFWFKIEGNKNEIYQGIQIPINTHRAVIEIYVSFHNNDEFWYSNPPSYYNRMNNLPTQKGHGAYREVLLRIDNNTVGSVIPFPVIFTGGINPLFWKPLVPIGAFNFPSYEIELTPFLGLLLDEKVHYFELGVTDAISYWLVNANLHLWLDKQAYKVEAGPIRYLEPSNCLERESKFDNLNGEFEIEGERRSRFSGWVKSSAGKITCHVWTRTEFENTIEFEKNGAIKTVKQELKVMNKVEMKSSLGYMISNISVERIYPLRLKMESNGHSISIELDQSLKEEKKKNHNFESELVNRQRCKGWMAVGNGDGMVSGRASSFQSYFVEDSYGCYGRRVSVENGAIDSDNESFLCAVAAAA